MPISENGVSFFGSGGHSHNGVNSTIIDVGSYSLFDFSLGYTGSQSRINRQSVNQNAMEDWIVRTINSKVLQPAGLNLAPDTLNGKVIRANTITATHIQANSITADEIAANTITAGELKTNLVLVNNVISSSNYSEGVSGWSINSNGDAEFSNVKVRGNVGGWTVNTSAIAGGGTILYSNGTVSGAVLSGGELTVGTLDGNPGSAGIEIKDGYIRHGGGGVRVKDFNGSFACTVLYTDQIFTRDYYGDSFNIAGSLTAKTIGVVITTDGNRPLILRRDYVASSKFISFVNITSGSNVGHVAFNNTTSVVYETTSDQRLKENLVEIKDAIKVIKNIIPYSFNYKEAPEHPTHGFVAQQVYEHYPYPVSVGGDDPKHEPWMVDYSRFSPIIVAALKEVIEKVENLEARLQALEDV